MEPGFKKHQVVRSLRQFREKCSPVFNAHYRSFPERFDALMHFCESDDVVRVYTSRLKQTGLSFDHWFALLPKRTDGMTEFHLPSDEIQKTALCYRICLKIYRRELSVFTFSSSFHGPLTPDGAVAYFNLNIVRPFADATNYRIDDILYAISEEYRESPVIPRSVLGLWPGDNAPGDTAATPGGEVDTDPAAAGGQDRSYGTGAKGTSRLQDMKKMVRDVLFRKR